MRTLCGGLQYKKFTGFGCHSIIQGKNIVWWRHSPNVTAGFSVRKFVTVSHHYLWDWVWLLVTRKNKLMREACVTRQACSEYTLFILRLTFKRGAPYSGRPVWCHCGFRAKTSRFSAGQQVCQQNPHYFQTHCCYHSNCSGWSTEIFEDPPFPALRVTRLLHFRGIKFLLINLCP